MTPLGLRARVALVLAGLIPLCAIPLYVVALRLAHLASTERIDPAALALLFAGYLTLSLLLLGVALYLAVARSVVVPIERLELAAERVATGSKRFDVSRSGARELVELGESIARMAHRLLANEETLATQVRELTRLTDELGRAQAELVAADRLASVGLLAAGVAHEIGNPLAAVVGLTELVRDPALAEGERAEFLARIATELTRIGSIVRDLVDFARPERGPGMTNVIAAARDVVALLRHDRDVALVAIEVYGETECVAIIDGQRLRQIVLNLVRNAAQALRDAPAPRIAVRVERAGTNVHLVVEDNGPGVDDAMRPQLFAPFATTKSAGHGSGLGLAVSRSLAEAVGGTLTLDSRFDNGARFVLTLPASLDAR